ncbi:hypothetical protein [Comamonas thiooxydans]|uniref:hypothetical protein n=1 Tax=Comamonas thiooxydans TaxID=363952 RepID=UPI001CC978D8|nr:hypothetical protein [Comamonas thiooxydans]UBQ43564.1 hypothetical protein LCH15_08885 [Comamonas thiooxydans]
MKKSILSLLAASILAVPMLAAADDDDDDDRRGYRQREYKEEYWDGNCKVEREMKKDGEYKEKRECKGGPVYHRRSPAYAPSPVYLSPEPGVVIRGMMRLQ